MTLKLDFNINCFAFIEIMRGFPSNTRVVTKNNCDVSIELEDKITFDHTM